MAIVDTLGKNQFINGFDVIGRGENFTREGRGVLFDFYEELSEGIGENIEFDPIAICCDWSECTAEEMIELYGESGDTLEEVLDTLGEEGMPVFPVSQYGEEDTYLVEAN